MIRIADIPMHLEYSGAELRAAAAKKLRLDAAKLKMVTVVKKSVDARKKNDVKFIVTVDVEIQGNEEKLISRLRDSKVRTAPDRT